MCFFFFVFFYYLREEAISESANKKVRVFFNRATERHAIFFRGKRNDKERIANWTPAYTSLLLLSIATRFAESLRYNAT